MGDNPHGFPDKLTQFLDGGPPNGATPAMAEAFHEAAALPPPKPRLRWCSWTNKHIFGVGFAFTGKAVIIMLGHRRIELSRQ